jgi:hypothetical protein
MPAKRTFAGLAAVAVLTITSATACGDDDTGGTGDPDAAPRLDTVTGALATLPEAGAEPTGILWGDLARAAEIAGLERPTDPTDGDAVRAYLQGLTGVRPDAAARDGGTTVALVPPQVARIEPSTDLGLFVDDVGWSILQVDRFVEVDPTGDGVTVLEGTFDDDALTAALGDAGDGTWVAGSAEPGGVAPDDRSPARPIGESLWLSGGDRHLSISRSPDAIEAATALRGRGDDGLGADPVLAGLATALDEQSAYAALLVRPGINDPAVGILGAGSAGTGDPADDIAAFCDQLLTEGTTGVATGVAEHDGTVIVVALAHESPAAAAANAAALEEMIANGTSRYAERPWRDLVELDGIVTTAEDLVTVARLRPSDPADTNLWYDLVQTRDTLVNSC